MNKKLYYDILLGFYGSLLTERQQRICEAYFSEDESLQEISEEENVSRSAVYDTVKTCRSELDQYEEKLHLYSDSRKRMKLYEMIRKAGNKTVSSLVDQLINTETD